MPVFDQQRNQHGRSQPIELLTSAARTAGGSGATFAPGPGVLALTLNVTAASGTNPTLDVTVETSENGSAWTAAGSFAQKTGAGSERKLFSVDKLVRVSWALGGTAPSFTFSVAGDVG